jgi:cytochrome c oxidase subunit 1
VTAARTWAAVTFFEQDRIRRTKYHLTPTNDFHPRSNRIRHGHCRCLTDVRRRRVQEHTGLWSWLTTVDHKRIGVLYLYTSLFFFLFGGLEAVIIRAQLAGPNKHLVSAEIATSCSRCTARRWSSSPSCRCRLRSSTSSFRCRSARATSPSRDSTHSAIGCLFGGLFITLPIFFAAAPDGGWFGYAPLTTPQFSPGVNIDFWVLGIQILGISSLAAAFNFITTIVNMRAPGMT